jgi:mRNA-degrading endonuclease toxin of MazEF toxin-antitoxin module
MNLFDQGAIVFADFDIPGQGKKEHPCIVISDIETQKNENFIICLMLTSNGRKDQFSFNIEKSMLTVPINNKENSQVRLHLVHTIHVKDVSDSFGKSKLKLKELKNLLKAFNKIVLNN